MTSQVNPNNIDGTYPVAGQDNDSQGFRDNFTNIRNNFTYIKAEVEDLQNKAVLKSALINNTLDNNLQGNALVGAALTSWREVYYDAGAVSGAYTVDFDRGNVQRLTLAGDTTLSFNWPTNTNNQYASVKLWITVTDSSYDLTFPSILTLGDPTSISGLSGTPPKITIPAAEVAINTDFLFEIFTFNAGATLGIKDLIRNRDIDLSGFTVSGSLTVDNITATQYITSQSSVTGQSIVTTNGVFWAGNGEPFSPALTTIDTSGTIKASGNIVAASGTASTNTTSGALVVTGGAGIAGAIYSGSTLIAAGNIVAAATTASGDSSTGALVVKGGLGVAANVNVDGNLWISSGNIRTNASTANIFNFSGATISLGNATTNIFMGVSTGNVNIGGNIVAGANARAASFVPTSTSIPAYGMYTPGANQIGFSTNFTPNWLINASGTLVPQTDDTFDIGSSTNRVRSVYGSRQSVFGSGTTTSNLVAAATTVSTSTTTGALVVAGGAGIAGTATIGNVVLTAGGTTRAPLLFTSGTNLTAPLAGAVEYDGAVVYATNDTTVGRGMVPTTQMFKLTAAGTGITATTTGTNYFGASSNIPLVASGIYEIEIVAYFAKTTATTAIWYLNFTGAAPTAYNVYYEMSPITGIVAPPGTATMLVGEAYNQTTQTYSVTTGTLTTGVNHYARFRLFVVAGASTTGLQIQAYNGASGTITPGIGSFWKATRLPATNNSTYVA